MSSDGSVTHWIHQLKAGEAAAVRPLWERYFERLVRLARGKLAGAPRGAADEEDVALSALDSFFRAVDRGRFPQLDDRDDLWGLLMVITLRKAYRLIHHERRQKRGGGKVLPEAALTGPADSTGPSALEQVLGREPTPEFAAQLVEECQRLFDCLPEGELRLIAGWKLEGYTETEIANKLGCVPRTIQRKLGRIRSLWAEEAGS